MDLESKPIKVSETEANLRSTTYPFEQHYVFLSGHIVHLADPLPIFKDLKSRGILNNEDYLKLELALDEAIANAVEHGNLELASSLKEEFDAEGKDQYSKLKEERLKDNRYASRFVFVSAYANADELRVVVRDEGAGFLQSSGSSTQILESNFDLPQCSGRGLILIRAASDNVSFNSTGNQVEFTKRIKA